MPEYISASADADVFRRHRHDVLNELQLVRGYLQMGQSDKAVAVIDRTAAWIQSLSRWQINGAVNGEQWMWGASICPNITLAEIDCSVPENLAIDSDALTRWLLDTQAQLAVDGARTTIRLRLQADVCEIISDMQVATVLRWREAYPTLRFAVSEGDL